MRKSRIILAGICLMAGIGGALAFKARDTSGWITVGGVYQFEANLGKDCPRTGGGCTIERNEGIYQVYRALGGGQYVALKQ